MIKKVGLGLLILLIGAFFLRLYAAAQKSQQMSALVSSSREALDGCPPRPSCVSTSVAASDDQHYVDPLTLATVKSEKIVKAIKATGGEIKVRTESYFHAEYHSKLFGFIDDLEVLLKDGQVLVRSLSRQGYSDLGANRKRVEELFQNIQR